MKTLTLRSPRKAAAATLATAMAVSLLGTPALANPTDSITELTLNGQAGTVSITAPASSLATPIDLGALNTGLAGPQALPNSLGGVTVSDTSTGLLRVATVTVTSNLDSGTTAFCHDDDGDISGGITCTGDAEDTVLSAATLYDWNTVTESGDGVGVADTVEADLAIGAANAVFTQVLPGSYQLDWDPIISITMLPTQAAGTYYGSLQHSVTTV